MPDPDPRPSERRLRANVTCIRVMNFTWMFMLIMPYAVPYMRSLGLDMQQVYGAQAVFAVSVVALEVPSGYVSDLLGRKRCLLLAGLLHGVAFTLLAAVQGFQGVLAYEVLAAVAVALYSGTDVALLYDSLEALGEPDQRRRAMGQRLFWMQSGETIAALAAWTVYAGLFTGGPGPDGDDSGLLGDVATWNAVFGWLPFVAALALVEVPRPRMDPGTHWKNLRYVAHELLVRSPLVRRVLIGLVTYGLSTLLAVWAFQDYWDHLGVPRHAFPFVWAGYNLLVAVTGALAHRVEHRLGLGRTIVAIGCLPVLGYGGMAAAGHLPGGWLPLALGVGVGCAFQFGRGLTQVVIKDELNSRVPVEMRATANSVASLGARLGFAVLGTGMGTAIDRSGYSWTFGGLATICVLALLFVGLPLARGLVAERDAAPAGAPGSGGSGG